MMMGTDTQTRILEKGAQLIRRNGFNNTGLNEILKAADVPKGSFYYYFDSKEDFGLKLIEYLHRHISKSFYGYLSKGSDTPPLDRLRTFFEYFRESFTNEEEKCGCPIGNITQELAAVNPKFREKLHNVCSDILEPVRMCLDEALQTGDLRHDTDTGKLAEFIINSWQGALIYLKVADCGRPLEIFEEYVFDELLTCLRVSSVKGKE